MSDSDKRNALDELYAAVQTLTFLHHVEHHSGEGGSWWKQECCSGHHEMILKAGEELRALRAEVEHWKGAYNGAMASLADQSLKLGQEAHTARVEAEDLMAENAAMRDALTKQRMYAVATGKLTTPSAMHAMMQRMVDDIDDALLRREDERG